MGLIEKYLSKLSIQYRRYFGILTCSYTDFVGLQRIGLGKLADLRRKVIKNLQSLYQRAYSRMSKSLGSKTCFFCDTSNSLTREVKGSIFFVRRPTDSAKITRRNPQPFGMPIKRKIAREVRIEVRRSPPNPCVYSTAQLCEINSTKAEIIKKIYSRF